MNDTTNLKSLELEKFSQNASQMLLDLNQLPNFFASLGYELEQRGDGYRGMCPACRQAYAYIGVNGSRHRIYWKCYDRSCDSNNRNCDLHHNLLGLVKGLVPDRHLGTAIKTIAKFLGYEGRFDITNGKATAALDYVFLVDAEEHKKRLETAGFQVAVFRGDYADERLRRMYIACLLQDKGEEVAARLRTTTNSVVCLPSSYLFGLPSNQYESHIYKKAMAILKLAVRNRPSHPVAPRDDCDVGF